MAKPDSHQQCEKLLLSHWGLPKPVLAAFASKGLTELYPWQAAALECAAAGNNLVYCAPTSGGKSLVAEVVMLSRMHQAQQALHQAQQGSHRQAGALPRGLLVLPYLSIVAEKTAHLSLLLEGMKWRVTGYKGEEQGTPLAGKSERIAICSIEKANMAINHLIQEQRLHELVSVVVDEAHMLADPHRGAALEMLLSKLVACRGRCSVQVVAMSATMSGLDSLSAWLGGHLFLTNFRPVPLSEHAVFGGTVYAKAGQTSGGGSDANDWPLVEQRRLPVQGKSDRDALLALVAEVVVESHSVLVFCAGRAAAQSCAAMLAGELGRLVGPPSAAQAAARAELVAELRVALAGGVNAELERMMAAGVAYHHAGLTHQERGVVEAGYRSGALLALTATSTLAAGVNLPARRVILRSLWQGAGPVGRAQYLQMVGRAGRAGQSPVGESFLMGQGAAGSATSGQWAAVCALMSAPLPALCSQLVAQPSQQPAASMGQPSGSGGQAAGSGPAQPQPAAAPLPGPECNAQPSLQQLLLHAVAAGLVGTGPSVLSLLQSTLSYHQLPFADLADAARSALTALRARRLLSLKPEGPSRPSAWELTPLGEAVVASMLPPDLGLLLHSRMSNLMSCLVLGGHLHLLFMLQPDPLLAIYDWNAWARLTKDFTAAHKRVADVEGVQLSYIDRRIAGMRGDAATDAKHARLAGAVLLDMVVGDASCVHSLEGAWGQPNGLTKAGITRGQMQQWQAEVSKTAAMAALLASNAGWWQLEALLAPLSAQAAAGVRPELLPLMEVSGMQPSHAAALHAAGYLRPELLVCAAESEIAAALAAKLPANPLKRKDNDKKKQQGLGGYGTNALVARAAKSLLAAARQHVVLAATAKAADAELGGTQVDAFSLVRPLSGQAAVHQVQARQDDPLLQQLLDAWQLQPSFAFAVVADQRQCNVPGCPASSGTMQRIFNTAGDTTGDVGLPPCNTLHCPRPTHLVLCWADKEAAVLHLPSCSPPGEDAVSRRIWTVVKAVFEDATRIATCCGSAAAIAALAAVGVHCRLTVDDPCVAFLLWQPRALEQLAEQAQQQQYSDEKQQHMSPEADVMHAAQALVLSNSFRLSVPVMEGILASAARTALLARALMPPLRAILVQHRLCHTYECVERPLQRVFAGVRVDGLRMALSSIEGQLQECKQQRVVLQQHASKLLHGHNSIDISVPAHVRLLLTQLHLVHSKREHQSQQPLIVVLQDSVRNALKYNQHQLLPLLRCLLSYHLLENKEETLRALAQMAMGPDVDSDSIMRRSGACDVVLQPLPYCAALSGGVVTGLPSCLDFLTQQQVSPCLPVVASEGSMADLGITSLASPTPVVAMLPCHRHDAQCEHYEQQWVMLCSVAEASPMNVVNSLLPLHDLGGSAACTHSGCVRYWCSTTNTIQDAQLCTSLLHTMETTLDACLPVESVTLMPGPVGILSFVQPCDEACTFVGLDLQQLPLVVIAALSSDPVLLAALSASDPLEAAAAQWVKCTGLHASTQDKLQSHVAGGALNGTPVLSSCVQRALFGVALDALVMGQKPSVQRALLGLVQSVDLADSLLVAFPALASWRTDMLEECRRTGYLNTWLRKIPFKLPKPPTNGADARVVKAAERTATSVAILACCGDLERMAMVAFNESCSTCLSCRLAVCGGGMVAAQVPSSFAVVLLKSLAMDVTDKMLATVKLASPSKLPFWWWWGPNLDMLRTNRFTV